MDDNKTFREFAQLLKQSRFRQARKLLDNYARVFGSAAPERFPAEWEHAMRLHPPPERIREAREMLEAEMRKARKEPNPRDRNRLLTALEPQRAALESMEEEWEASVRQAREKAGGRVEHAVRTGDVNALSAVLDAGADPDAPDEDGRTLVGRGCDIDATDPKGWSALAWALAKRQREMADAMVKLGAAPPTGGVALALAVRDGDAAKVQSLLREGVDPHSLDENGNPVLNVALLNRHASIAHALMKAGAKVDFRNEGGPTPLMMAACEGLGEMVKDLLKRGADPRAKDGQGRTAIDWAGKNPTPQSAAIVEMLRAAESTK